MVTVFGQTSALSSGTFAYAQPTVSGFGTTAALPTAGGSTITLVGNNFGWADVTNVPSVVYGAPSYAASACSVTVAHTQVRNSRSWCTFSGGRFIVISFLCRSSARALRASA